MSWDIRLGKGTAFSFPGGCSSLCIPVPSLPATGIAGMSALQEEVMSRDLPCSPFSQTEPFAELGKSPQCGNVRDVKVG